MAYIPIPGVADLIVAPTQAGGQLSFASALALVQPGQAIFIRSGTYNIGTVTIPPGITIFGPDGAGQSVILIGKVNYSGVGAVNISNLLFRTNSDFAINLTGNSNSVINFFSCTIDATNNTAINYSSSASPSSINFFECQIGVLDSGVTAFNNTSAGTIHFLRCNVTNFGNSAIASNSSVNSVFLDYSTFNIPISTSATSGLVCNSCQFYTSNTNTAALQMNGSGATQIEFLVAQSGSAENITVGSGATVGLSEATLNSTNAHAVTGTGVLNYGHLTFTNSSVTLDPGLTATAYTTL